VVRRSQRLLAPGCSCVGELRLQQGHKPGHQCASLVHDPGWFQGRTKFFFACQVGGDCKSGQHLTVTVKDSQAAKDQAAKDQAAAKAKADAAAKPAPSPARAAAKPSSAPAPAAACDDKADKKDACAQLKEAKDCTAAVKADCCTTCAKFAGGGGHAQAPAKPSPAAQDGNATKPGAQNVTKGGANTTGAVPAPTPASAGGHGTHNATATCPAPSPAGGDAHPAKKNITGAAGGDAHGAHNQTNATGPASAPAAGGCVDQAGKEDLCKGLSRPNDCTDLMKASCCAQCAALIKAGGDAHSKSPAPAPGVKQPSPAPGAECGDSFVASLVAELNSKDGSLKLTAGSVSGRVVQGNVTGGGPAQGPQGPAPAPVYKGPSPSPVLNECSYKSKTAGGACKCVEDNGPSTYCDYKSGSYGAAGGKDCKMYSGYYHDCCVSHIAGCSKSPPQNATAPAPAYRALRQRRPTTSRKAAGTAGPATTRSGAPAAG